MRHLALIVVLTALVAGGCGDDSTRDTEAQVTETTEAQTTTTDAVASTIEATVTETANIQIARDSMAAWNTGDIDAFLGFFTDDAILLEWPAHADHVRNSLEFMMALGDRTVMDECEEWQDGRIRCHATNRNDLSGPVGAIAEIDRTFWITDGRISKYTVTIHDESDYYFIRQMAWWLESAHPEVWETTFAIPEQCSYDDEFDCFETWYATPETAAALLEYAPEFIAQSDLYSITE